MNFEVIVVDNASFDGCDLILEKEFPGVIFIQSKENIGFAKANNLGFKHSSGRNILFLNPDTKMIGACLSVLCNNLDSIPDAGAVGGKLLNEDLSIQSSCIQAFPTVLNQILAIEYLKARLPILKFGGINPLFFNKGMPEEVEAVSGACLMIKRNLFEKIAEFSTDYFMYAEDVDLCYKVQNAGYKVYYVSDAQVMHYGGGSSKKHESDIGIVLLRESIFKFFQLRKGKLHAIFYRSSMLVVSLARLSLISIVISLPFRNDNKPKFHYIFSKWKKILRWSLGFEGWAAELNKK